MGHRQDDPYDAWGHDRRKHPGEQQWIDDMRGGMDERRISLFVPESPTRLVEREADQALVDATNADNECVHGNLPDDPGLLCDCWDQHEHAGRTVSLEPFRKRFEEMEPNVREGHAMGGPGKQPRDAAIAIAIRLGWFSRGRPDGDRVRRTIGLKAQANGQRNGKHYPPAHRQRIRRRTALQLCEAMGLDPAEVGL